MANAFDKNGLPQINTAFKNAADLPAGWKSDYFINSNHERIWYAKIPAQLGTNQEVRGTVVLTTGYNDSIFNNKDTIREWQKRGFDVYAMDWASQGFSQRNPLHPNLPSSRPLDYHVRDLDQFIRNIVMPSAEKPLILSTHSMGGAIGALYMQKHPDIFAKAVLAAPMLDLDTSILPRKWFKTIAKVANDVGLKDTSLPNWRDRLYDIKNFNPFVKTKSANPDKLSTVFAAADDNFKPYQLKLPTWGWVESAYQSMDKINRPDFYKGIKTDILFISAGRDELVDNNAIRKASAQLPNSRLLELPHAQHSVWKSLAEDKTNLWSSIDGMLDGTAQISVKTNKLKEVSLMQERAFSTAFA